MMTSVARGPCGPCCSVAPVGMMTVSWLFKKVSTSGLVISPRNTVGGFIALSPKIGYSGVDRSSRGSGLGLRGPRSESRETTDLGRRGLRHDVDLQRRIGRGYVGLFQPELRADDVAALRDGTRLVKSDFAVASLSAETAIARDDELLGIDVLERGADGAGNVLGAIRLQRPVAHRADADLFRQLAL